MACEELLLFEDVLNLAAFDSPHSETQNDWINVIKLLMKFELTKFIEKMVLKLSTSFIGRRNYILNYILASFVQSG